MAQNIQPCWNYHNEHTIENGILMKNQKFIIPTSLKENYLKRIHSGHQGSNSHLKKARQFLFQVNYTKDIQEKIMKCAMYQSNRNGIL